MCCAQSRGPTSSFSSKEITFIEDWLAKREAGSLSAAEADELQQILASLIYTLSAGF